MWIVKYLDFGVIKGSFNIKCFVFFKLNIWYREGFVKDLVNWVNNVDCVWLLCYGLFCL